MIDNTETNNTDTLGKRIMALRKAAGMTQEQVAERLGVSPQAVSKWENDVSCPDVTMIPRIAQLFNVSTDELLGLKASTVRPADTSSYSHGNGSCCKSSSATQGIGFGLLLIVLGIAYLVSRSTNASFNIWGILWPALLLGLGVSSAIKHRSVFFLGVAGMGFYYLRLPGLYLLTAPVRIRRDPVTASQMGTLLRQVRQKFDFCLLDAPAGLGRGFRLATCAADRCVVVTTSDASSLRDAQHTVMELGRFPNGTLHLVVNRVRKKLLRSMHATIDDAIDRAGLPLLGVVPEDDSLPLSLNQGMPPLPPQASAAAYRNIAHRLQGQRVPLLRIK